MLSPLCSQYLLCSLKGFKTETKLFFNGAFRDHVRRSGFSGFVLQRHQSKEQQDGFSASVCTHLALHGCELVHAWECVFIWVCVRSCVCVQENKDLSNIFIDQNNGSFWSSDSRPWQAAVKMWPIADKKAAVKTRFCTVIFSCYLNGEASNYQGCKMMCLILSVGNTNVLVKMEAIDMPHNYLQIH